MPAYRLPEIPYLRLCTTLVAEEPARLPPFQGSTLRGAFGHALRDLVCAMGPEQACGTCTLRAPCTYTRLFEPFMADAPGPTPPLLRGIGTAPRPYVFEPANERESFRPGDLLRFDLLLLGRATELHPYAAVALERMAAAGLGRDRRRFRLAELATPPEPALLPPPAAAAPEAPAGAPERLRLRFATPTRLASRRRLADRPTVRDLVFRMLRRALETAHLHAPGARVDWHFRPYLDHARAVEITATDLHWHDWRRRSNRQHRHVDMGGLVGTLDLAGDLAPFLPLLRTAEVLHLGKGATLGLGKVEVEI